MRVNTFDTAILALIVTATCLLYAISCGPIGGAAADCVDWERMAREGAARSNIVTE